MPTLIFVLLFSTLTPVTEVTTVQYSTVQQIKSTSVTVKSRKAHNNSQHQLS